MIASFLLHHSCGDEVMAWRILVRILYQQKYRLAEVFADGLPGLNLAEYQVRAHLRSGYNYMNNRYATGSALWRSLVNRAVPSSKKYLPATNSMAITMAFNVFL